MKDFKDYETINKSTKAPKATFLKNLKDYYGTLTKLELKNECLDNFYYSHEVVEETELVFKKLVKEAISLREIDKKAYLTSGYVVSEINSSLKTEGVHSSRKITEMVLKNINEKRTWHSSDQVEKLIRDYYQSLQFILSQPAINEKNLFTLYSFLTADVTENVIEDKQWYRQGDVGIGFDHGVNFQDIPQHISSLINWINSEELETNIHSKAIIAHYAFENIHPYYDFNGRMGRLLHLWILINHSIDSFWELTFLSEAIYSFKGQFGTMFNKILKAKKNNANIDLTFVVATFFDIFIKHTNAYIEMKKIVGKAKVSPSRLIRLFIIDMICMDNNYQRWFTINDFKKSFPDYSSAQYGKITKEVQELGIFDVQISNPIRFSLKK